jgi:hypothetical protein
MTKTRILAVVCAFEAVLATTAVAKNIQTKAAAAHDGRQTKSLAVASKSGRILRQDLFDRLNQNNLRSDWPAPPAQPGQF